MNHTFSKGDRVTITREGMENEMGTVQRIVKGTFGPSYHVRLDHDCGTYAFAIHELAVPREVVATSNLVAKAVLAEIQSRGVVVTVEYRSETGTSGVSRVARLALTGGRQRPGDFDRLGRQKSAIVAILEARGAITDAYQADGAEEVFEGGRYKNLSRTARAGRGMK